jgi:hypothetical protein
LHLYYMSKLKYNFKQLYKRGFCKGTIIKGYIKIIIIIL